MNGNEQEQRSRRNAYGRSKKREAAGSWTHACQEGSSGLDGVTLVQTHMTVGTLSVDACDLGLVN